MYPAGKVEGLVSGEATESLVTLHLVQRSVLHGATRHCRARAIDLANGRSKSVQLSQVLRRQDDAGSGIDDARWLLRFDQYSIEFAGEEAAEVNKLLGLVDGGGQRGEGEILRCAPVKVLGWKASRYGFGRVLRVKLLAQGVDHEVVHGRS